MGRFCWLSFGNEFFSSGYSARMLRTSWRCNNVQSSPMRTESKVLWPRRRRLAGLWITFGKLDWCRRTRCWFNVRLSAIAQHSNWRWYGCFLARALASSWFCLGCLTASWKARSLGQAWLLRKEHQPKGILMLLFWKLLFSSYNIIIASCAF